MPARAKFIVTCVLVMDCADLELCRQAERRLHQRGFESRSCSEGAGRCTRSLEREFASGAVGTLLDEVCRDLEMAIALKVSDWKAFVQICGTESAWATLEAGKPTLRGSVPTRIRI
jgi:hypothetical protein